MMLVAVDRRRPKTALGCQISEEPGKLVDERILTMRTTAADKAGHHQPQHLLNRAADLLGDLTASFALATTPHAAIPRNPFGYELLDMRRQILHGAGAPSSRELAEREHQRNPTQHRPRRVPVLGQPHDIALNLAADPARPDPIDRLR